jgi:uncharacterized protein (UPF0335 family)
LTDALIKRYVSVVTLNEVRAMRRGRPRIGTPEEAAARRREKTAERVRRLRRRQAEKAASTPAQVPAASPRPVPPHPILASLVERIERLERELRSAHPDERHYARKDLQDVYDEASDIGFDRIALKEVVRLRKMPDTERREFDELVRLYRQALGLA